MVGEIVSLITSVGKLALWLQTIGIIVVLWLVFQLISWYYNRKRMAEVYAIKRDMKRIEGKIDKLLKI